MFTYRGEEVRAYVALVAERDVWPAMLRALNDAMNTTDNIADEYEKPRSERRLIFLQNFSSEYSQDLDAEYAKRYGLAEPESKAPEAAPMLAGRRGRRSALPFGSVEKPKKKGFIMEMRVITPFHADADYLHPNPFITNTLAAQLPIKAKAELAKLQGKLAELDTQSVRFRFSTPKVYRLDSVKDVAVGGTDRSSSLADGEMEDKFSDPARPGESMADDKFFWIHWKVYIEKDPQEAPGPTDSRRRTTRR